MQVIFQCPVEFGNYPAHNDRRPGLGRSTVFEFTGGDSAFAGYHLETLAMKRSIKRVAAVSAIVGVGAVGIVQVGRKFHKAEEPAAPPPATAQAQEAQPKPIPLVADLQPDPSAGPFAARSFGKSHEPSRKGPRHGERPSRFSGVQTAAVENDEQSFPSRSAPAKRPHHSAPSGDDLGSKRGPDPFGLQRAQAEDVTAFTEQPAEGDPAQQPATEPPARSAAVAEPRRLRFGEAEETSAMTAAQKAAETRSQTGGPFAKTPAIIEAGTENFQSPSDRSQDSPPAGEGTGRPGAQQLEGSQTPTLTIEKAAPAEIQVGKPATFTIKVRNTGSATASGVEIHDEVPKGTQLVSTTPKARQEADGKLVWDLGGMKPGAETTAQMQLMPLSEGEIGSVATVTFRADASVRTKATKPELTVKVTGPTKVMIGENAVLKIKISNPGSGAASGIVLSENVPPGLKHAAGKELEFEVGTLRPGESRELDLMLTAVEPGMADNLLTAHADANLQAEDHAQLEVIAPALKLSMTGPKRRYLERSATYNISVSNPGTAPAKDIELVTTLPKGLKFVEANNAGQYDKATHSVYWSLEELPAQESGSVTLTTLPIEPGELKMQIKGQAKQGLSDSREEIVAVEGLSAILFELVDVSDPIEVNGETSYEIRVINQGSKAAGNIQIVALLPEEMKPLSADGPTRFTIDGQRVVFQSLASLAPKADTTYTFKARALQPGDLRVRVQLMSDEIRTPITKEESTRVYADE